MADSWIVRAAMDALASVPKSALPAFYAVPYPISQLEMEMLLGFNGISGLLVTPKTAGDMVSDFRIGIITDNGNWILPKTTAHSLLLLKDPGLLALRLLWAFLRSGLYGIIHIDDYKIWRVSPLYLWVFPKLVERLRDVLTTYSVTLADLYRWMCLRRIDTLVRHHVRVPAEHFVPDRFALVSFSLAAGGAERQVINTALAMAKKGHDIALWCFSLGTEETDFYRHIVQPQVPIRLIRHPLETRFSESLDVMDGIQHYMSSFGMENFAGMLPPWVIVDIQSCAAQILIERPSVVHLWQDYCNVVGGLAALLVGVPRIVLGMRNLAPFHFAYFQPFMAPIYRVLARHPHVVMINNSAAGTADYAAWLGLEPDRIRILHNGIDDEIEKPSSAEVDAWRQWAGLAPDTPVIGGILRFDPEKNPLLWIETAAAVAKIRPDVQFLLVGDGAMRAKIVHLAETLGISNRLRMPGTVKDIRLPLAAMDIFLLTSRVEGLPNVLIEAQMHGCPVVTTKAGGSAEAVDHGRTGWVVSNHAPHDLAERLVMVLDDAEWRRVASVSARSFALLRFGVTRMVEETLHSYKIM